VTSTGCVLRAEWTKLWTSPGTVWLLLGVVAATAGVGGLTVATLTCPAGSCAVDPTKLSLTGVQAGQAVVAILAVLVIGGEYSTGLVHTSLAAVPRRPVLLAAKAIVLAGVVLLAAAPAVLASMLIGGPVLTAHGFTVPSFTDGTVLRAAGGSVLYLVLIALLSLGVATAVRNPASAIGVVLALLYVFPILVGAVSDPDWKRHLEQLGPMSAGLAVQATTHLDDLPIGPWAGLGVLAGWAAAALLGGGILLQARDA
jgi:ABC-2 type transport system permease protein